MLVAQNEFLQHSLSSQSMVPSVKHEARLTVETVSQTTQKARHEPLSTARHYVAQPNTLFNGQIDTLDNQMDGVESQMCN